LLCEFGICSYQKGVNLGFDLQFDSKRSEGCKVYNSNLAPGQSALVLERSIGQELSVENEELLLISSEGELWARYNWGFSQNRLTVDLASLELSVGRYYLKSFGCNQSLYWGL
jgi:hypothetical protein